MSRSTAAGVSDIPKTMVRNRVGYGAVIFDGPDDATEGWAAIPGADPFRIRGTGDLVRDTVWWTNFDFANYAKAGLSHNSWTRRSDFPKIDHRKTILEWGMDEGVPYEERVTFLAEVFDRIMRLSKNFGIEAFTGELLADDFAETFFRPKPIDIPSMNVADALRNTVQLWSTPPGAKPRGSENVILRRPRLSYAATMLRCKYPRGPWRYLSTEDLAEKGDALEYLFSLGVPFFANISVDGIDRSVADTIAFGSSLGARRELRSWASSPELEILARHADIEVHNAWVATVIEEPKLPECISSLLDSPLANSSWSIGIVAENLWRGIMAPRKRTREQNGKIYSYRGAWIASLDRADTMTAAIDLARDGFFVSGYGGGQVHVSVLHGDHARLIESAFKNGLHPTLAHANAKGRGNVDIPETWGGAAGDEPGAILTTMGEREPLLAIDRAVFEPHERQLQVFDEILGGSEEPEE